MKGSIFSIEEFSVYDGPGIRTSVFLKGCPLRCNWCHNPEGLQRGPQRLRSSNGCLHCGRCEAVCTHGEQCVACGACVQACPQRLISIVGEEQDAADIAARVLKNADILTASGGGVTFSGGEVLMQPDFLLALLDETRPLHRAIETSGYASEGVFTRAIHACDLVMMDIKHSDPALHKRYTGVDPAPIYQNLSILKQSDVPFIARIPLIPGVTDTQDNLAQTARLLTGSENLLRVELLPYHRAGGKYAAAGQTFHPLFDEDQPVQIRTDIFTAHGLPVAVL